MVFRDEPKKTRSSERAFLATRILTYSSIGSYVAGIGTGIGSDML
jgi:hypothetical protein